MTAMREDEGSSSDSDYLVEEFIRPKRIRRTVNDDSADILGNFDDQKRKEILDGTYEDKPAAIVERLQSASADTEEGEEREWLQKRLKSADSVEEKSQKEVPKVKQPKNTQTAKEEAAEGDDEDKSGEEMDESEESDADEAGESSANEDEEDESSANEDEEVAEEGDSNSGQANTEAPANGEAEDAEAEADAETAMANKGLTKEQLASLLRGTKATRHVLYVTNLNFDTTRDDLIEYFGRVGPVKSVRFPKKRRGGFAFVEMQELEGFQRGFQFHNKQLHGRTIKVQFTEAGKKKSANQKNIIRQKNRKLAKMRNEHKTFTKSGKFYDKDLKKEKAKETLARKRWRKKPQPRT